MSYYYNYYLGYKKDGMIYPAGPFDEKGGIYPLLSRPSSCASELHRRFFKISNGQISDEIRKYFEYTTYKDEKIVDVKYLPLIKLPIGSYIKRGYVLIDEVTIYEKNIEENEGDPSFFSEVLPPISYGAKLLNEFASSSKIEKNNDDGKVAEDKNEDYRDSTHKATDYMFYAFPDYCCEEYECDVIRRFAEAYDILSYSKKYDELVILETEG